MDEQHLFILNEDNGGYCTACDSDDSYNHFTCVSCGQFTVKLDFVPNPYEFDINGDDTSRWYCDECYSSIAAEVIND